MRRVMKVAALAVAGALALAACGSSSSSGGGAGTSGSPAATSNIKVGLAYDVGGRGDKSFNDAAAVGLDKAKTDFGIQTKELSAVVGETDAQKEERLRLLAAGGYNPVIAVGFAYATATKKVAAEYPKVNFAIIDDSSFSAKNVANLVFAENEGSYLVGVIAAQASKTGNIGYIGGVLTPLLQKFEAGYTAGAKSINPSIKVQVKYLTQPPDFSGFNAPDKGQTAAQGMYDAGADVVFAAAGGSGSGVFKAAKASGKLAIGVDSDQYLTASADVKDVILTSMIKRVDTAVYNFIKSAVDGSPLTGVQTFDLKKDGVGYSKSNSAVQPYEAKADAAAEQIKSGAITVPTTP
ncbi:MAG TPA: BMP family ABC transporter substrate-binding protein [Actinomycetes bacterium]